MAFNVPLHPTGHRRILRRLTIRINVLHHHRVYTALLPRFDIGSNEERGGVAVGGDWRDRGMGIKCKWRRMGRGMVVCARRGQGQQGIVMLGKALNAHSIGEDARTGLWQEPRPAMFKNRPSIQLERYNASLPHVKSRSILQKHVFSSRRPTLDGAPDNGHHNSMIGRHGHVLVPRLASYIVYECMHIPRCH